MDSYLTKKYMDLSAKVDSIREENKLNSTRLKPARMHIYY